MKYQHRKDTKDNAKISKRLILVDEKNRCTENIVNHNHYRIDCVNFVYREINLKKLIAVWFFF